MNLGGGTNVYITVNAHVGANLYEAGEEIAAALVEYEQSSGTRWHTVNRDGL